MNLKLSFEKYSRNNKLMSILMVVLGVVLFIWPDKTLALAARILGIALLLGAAVSLYSWYRDRNRAGSSYGSLALAIVCGIVGLIVIIAPRGVISLLPKLIGAAVLLNGILNLAQAVELRRTNGSNWISALVMAVLTILCGLFLIFFAFSVVKVAVMVIGGIFVFNGVSNLWIESKYR